MVDEKLDTNETISKISIISLLQNSNASLETIKELIEKGDNINDVGESLMTPLHYCCLNGQYKLAKLLIKEGAKKNTLDLKGKFPIYYSIIKGFKNIVNLLADDKEDFTRKLIYQYVLFESCEFQKKRIILHSLFKGAKINKKNRHNMTALHCSSKSTEKFISLLLKNQGNIEAISKYGWTTLMFSVMNNNIQIVNLLLSKGVNTQVKDGDGNSVLNIAVNINNNKILELLKFKIKNFN